MHEQMGDIIREIEGIKVSNANAVLKKQCQRYRIPLMGSWADKT